MSLPERLGARGGPEGAEAWLLAAAGRLAAPSSPLGAAVYVRFAKRRGIWELSTPGGQSTAPREGRASPWFGLSRNSCLFRSDVHRHPSRGPRGDQGDHGHAAVRSHSRPPRLCPVSSPGGSLAVCGLAARGGARREDFGSSDSGPGPLIAAPTVEGSTVNHTNPIFHSSLMYYLQ